MPINLPELISLLISSVLSLGLTFFQVPITTLQKIIALLIILIAFFINRPLFFDNKFINKTYIKLLLLFCSSFLVQLIVLGSGGLYSPFLILVYLYTLGLSFFITSKASLTFLIFSLVILVAQIFLDQKARILFNQDPNTPLLYLISFVVVIPVGELLARHYKLKDKISGILTKQVEIEQSILAGINELVVVTDKNLKILSINNIVEKLLQVSSDEVVNKPFLEIINLKDQNGTEATRELLSVDKVLTDRNGIIVKGYLLYPKNRTSPTRVIIKIQPIIDPISQKEQIIFVISTHHDLSAPSNLHSNLERARIKYEKLISEVKNSPNLPPTLRVKEELIEKLRQDIFLAAEIADHPFKFSPNFQDIAKLCLYSVLSKQSLAKTLNVKLDFNLPESEASEKAILNLSQSNLPSTILSTLKSDFIAVTDERYLMILLQKLLDIAIFLSLDDKNPTVQTSVQRGNNQIEIVITSTFYKISAVQQKQLFVEYFGTLGDTSHLYFASGLEGIIANQIASHMKIPIKATMIGKPKRFAFKLQISQQA